VTTLYAFRPDLRRKKLEILSEQYRLTFLILYGLIVPIFCEMTSVGPVTTLYAFRPDVKRRKLETYKRTLQTGLHDTVLYGPIGSICGI
jgi:hypothetical protein